MNGSHRCTPVVIGQRAWVMPVKRWFYSTRPSVGAYNPPLLVADVLSRQCCCTRAQAAHLELRDVPLPRPP